MNSMASLISTHLEQEPVEKAEEWKIKATQIKKRLWGKKHRAVLDTMANLAETCSQQERLDKVEKRKM